jgi:hypothetical protein
MKKQTATEIAGTDSAFALSRSATRRMHRVPSDGGAVSCKPLVVTEPGDYYLERDIFIDGDIGILIEAEDVFLDLNGRTVSGPREVDSKSIGVLVKSARNVRIAGGRVDGFRFGVLSPKTRDLTVEAVEVSESLNIGISVGGVRARIEGCHVHDIGGIRDEAYAVGVNVMGGEGVMLARSTIANIYRQGQADPATVGEGCAVVCSSNAGSIVVRDNVMTNDRVEAKTIGVFGGGGDHLVRNNLIRNFQFGVQGGGAPDRPTNVVDNYLVTKPAIGESEGLCVVYGRVTGNVVVGFQYGGRPNLSADSNRFLDQSGGVYSP